MKFGLVKNVVATAGKAACRTGLKLRKASPEIMLAGGLIVGAAAVVTACIATKKTVEEKIVEKAHTDLDDIQKKYADDPKEKKQQSFRVYKHLIFEFLKKFGLPAFLLVLSFGLILGSHGVLKKRYISTTIAYKTLDEAFKDYRERVREVEGEEKELHIFNGTEECGEITKIDENGDTHSEKMVQKVNSKKNAPYEFDWNCRTAPGNWEANTDYNLMFLRGIQNWANDRLNAVGHVFMNEILDAVGLKRTPEGQAIGWLKGSGGDDFVDFGISDYYDDEFTDIQNGKIKNIHLNFNVDGVIWDKI